MMRGFIRLVQKVSSIPQSFNGFLSKEIRLLTRKKKYLYLSLALPVIIGLIYLFMLNTSPNSLTVMVCNFDQTPTTQNALASITDLSITVNENDNCSTQLIKAVKDKKYLFGIVIPKGFGQEVKNLHQATLTTWYDNSDPSVSSLVQWRIDAALEPLRNQITMAFAKELQQTSNDAHEKITIGLEAINALQWSSLSKTEESITNADKELVRVAQSDEEFFSNPVLVQKKGVFKKYGMLEIGFAPLFAILNMFLLLMLCSTGVMYDRKIKLFSRIRASNSMKGTYVFAKLTFFFLLTVLQFIVLYVLFLLFKASFAVQISLLIKSLLLIASVNTLIGFLIGLVSDSEGVAVLISLIFTLPLLFLSGMFYPLKLMPKLVQFIAQLMPLQSQVGMLKKALLFGGSINTNLFLIPLILFFISILFMKKK